MKNMNIKNWIKLLSLLASILSAVINYAKNLKSENATDENKEKD